MSKQPDVESLYNAFRETAEPLIRQAFEAGFNTGFLFGHGEGEKVGFVKGITVCKPALSDGLRHGSSDCGRAMQALKNLLGDEEED